MDNKDKALKGRANDGPPLQGFVCFLTRTPGRCPGLVWFAPSVLGMLPAKVHDGNQIAAFSSAVCSAGFTLRRMAVISPSAPITNVVRSAPMYFFPYMLFSTHTP